MSELRKQLIEKLSQEFAQILANLAADTKRERELDALAKVVSKLARTVQDDAERNGALSLLLPQFERC